MVDKILSFLGKLAEAKILVGILFVAFGVAFLLMGITDVSGKFGISVTDQVSRYILIVFGGISMIAAMVSFYPVLFAGKNIGHQIRDIEPDTENLKTRLAKADFSPDLIIGLSRGG